MKKVTAFALALVLCLGLLAGCGGNNTQSSSSAPSQESGAPAPEEIGRASCRERV